MHSSAQLEALFTAIRNGTDETPSITELADKILFKHGINTPYQLEFRDLEGTDNANDDMIALPGNPVVIVISIRYLLECIFEKRNSIYFRHRLEKILEYIPRVHRTLRHPIPLSVAIALKKDTKTVIRIPAPAIADRLLKKKYLEITYKVKVKDKVTGTIVEMTGEDPVGIRAEAIKRLSMMIFEKDDLLDILDELESIREHHPSKVVLRGNDQSTNVKVEY